MFTPTITNVLKQDGKAHVSVSFTDGVTTVVRQYSVGTLDELKNRIRNDNTQLEQIESDTFANGVIDTTVSVVAPSQAELDKQAWLQDWRNLQGANKLVAELTAAGKTTEANAIKASGAYTNLATRVANNFIAGYVTLL